MTVDEPIAHIKSSCTDTTTGALDYHETEPTYARCTRRYLTEVMGEFSVTVKKEEVGINKL